MALQITLIPALGNNYIYLISSGSKACVIDPAEAQPVFKALDKRNLELEKILITHHHSDHVLGNTALKKRTNCTVIGPKDSRIPELDTGVEEGDKTSFRSIEFEILAVPGHTSSHIAYFSPKEKWLFSGDSLFAAGCGKIFEGSPAEMLASLRKIESLPDDTFIFCGHEYTENNLKFALSIEPENQKVAVRLNEVQNLRKEGKPTIPTLLSVEKQTNPFLRSQDEGLKRAVSMKEASDLEVFTHIRSLKDKF